MDINVEHIAKLARLGLNKQEEERLSKELSAILDFVEKLREVDVSHMEPMTGPPAKDWHWRAGGAFLNDVFRDDKQKPANKEQRAKILDNAPEKKDNFIKVKAVFE